MSSLAWTSSHRIGEQDLENEQRRHPCEDVFKGLGGGEKDCTESQRSKYYAKISGPLLDRIDIQVEVPALKFADFRAKGEAESSAAIKARVTAPWYVLPALTTCDLPDRVSFNVQ